MKTIINYLFLILILTTFSCKEKTLEQKTKEETQTVVEVEKVEPETTEKETTEEETTEEETVEEFNDPILLGQKSRGDIEAAPYSRWFAPAYEEYKVDTETIKEVATQLSDTHITVFMGTWCEDSQFQIPGLFKILDASSYDMSNFKLIAISEEKDTPEKLEEGLDITNVPTIIFSKDNSELGRIVEYPIESLEKDMAKIVSGEEYKHTYEE